MKNILLFALYCISQFILFSHVSAIDIPKYKTANHALQDTARKPLVSIEQIVLPPMKVLIIPETAGAVEDVEQLMRNDYGELFDFINKNGLQPGKIMAFYYTEEAPFMIMDVAVEVNKVPEVLTGRVKSIEIAGGPAIVVHYQGPYEQLGTAYAALNKWLEKHNKKAVEKPFESYLNDPDVVKDPWALRTDVYMCIK